MLYKGKKISGPATSVCVIPRGDEDFVFHVQCVVDYSEFDALVKAPKAPKLLVKGQGEAVDNVRDKTYIAAMDDYNKKQVSYMILKSIEPTKDLVWETVKMEDPSTWENYEKELSEAGFNNIHIGTLIREISTVNGLNERMMEEAKQRFLATKVVQEEQPSLQAGQPNT